MKQRQHYRRIWTRHGRKTIVVNKGLIKSLPRPKDAKLPLNFKGKVPEPKYDGTRMIMETIGSVPHFTNRRHVDKTQIFPELQDIRTTEDVILDGEIVTTTKERPYGDFERLQTRDNVKDLNKAKERSKHTPVTFIAFDILKKGDKDVTQLPWSERRKLLKGVIKPNVHIREIETSKDAQALLDKVKKANGEGIILKNPNSKYPQKQTREWEKHKITKENDVAILGYTPGINKRKPYFGALRMAVHTDKGFKEVGLVGSGLKDKDLKAIKERIDKGEKLVARIKFRKIGSQGNYIEPRFKGIREDISQKQTHNYGFYPEVEIGKYIKTQEKKQTILDRLFDDADEKT